jgi:hypothetical protein
VDPSWLHFIIPDLCVMMMVLRLLPLLETSAADGVFPKKTFRSHKAVSHFTEVLKGPHGPSIGEGEVQPQLALATWRSTPPMPMAFV